MANDPTTRDAQIAPTMEDEGQPGLADPLPEKVATGDPQEGVAPPRERPGASTAWGTTAAEASEGEPLDDKLAAERDDGPLAEVDRARTPSDERMYTGETVETEDGPRTPRQMNVGKDSMEGGGEWPDPDTPPQQ